MTQGSFGHQQLLTIAHRAGNDLDALRAAEDAGVSLIEADIWRFRGRLEVRHLKTAGPVPILWDRWKLASAWAPRLHLDDLLAAARPGTELMLDIKGKDRYLPGDIMRALDAVIPGRPVSVCSQNWDLLDAFRDRPEVRVVHSVGSGRMLRAVGARLTWYDRHAISIHHRLLTPAVVQTLKQRACTVMTWSVNTPERVHELRSWGVDGFISDNLGMLRDLVRAGERVGAGVPA